MIYQTTTTQEPMNLSNQLTNSLNLNLTSSSSHSHSNQQHPNDSNHTLSSISKPDPHLLLPNHPSHQISPSASDHELASLYAKYQSSSHTTTNTHSISSSPLSSSAHLNSIKPMDLYQFDKTSNPSSTNHQDHNQSSSMDETEDPNQTLRFDSESFESSISLQNQSQVLDELNLMLGEAINSAHSDFNHLQLTTTSPLIHQSAAHSNEPEMPVSTSYSSLLSSVKRKINANKLERQPDRRRSHSPQKISLQEALSSFDQSKADLTIASSTSSLSAYSQEKRGMDDEEEAEQEKVEKSDRLTPLPITKALSNDESESSSIQLDQITSSSCSTSVGHDSNQPNQQSPSPRLKKSSPTKLPSKIPSSPPSLQAQSPSTPIPINSYPQLISTISRPADTTPTKSSLPVSLPITRHHPVSPMNLHHKQSSPNLGQAPRKSLVISRSSSELSQLNQWQWLESHPTSELRGIPATHPTTLSTIETGPIRQESMSRIERRLKSLDDHYRSQSPKERSSEIRMKLNLLNKRQEWTNECIKSLSKNPTSKTKSINQLCKAPHLMNIKAIHHKEIKKIKSTVERCRIYAQSINEINSVPIGLDLWIWYKTNGVDQQESIKMLESNFNSNRYPTHLQQSHGPVRSSLEKLDPVRHSSTRVLEEEVGARSSINKLNYLPTPNSQPISPIPNHLQHFQLPSHHQVLPHSRDVSSGSSSVVSFPVRSDAVKAIEITEKKGTPQLMEVISNNTSSSKSSGGINPLIQVDNLPFPGLYQHGILPNPVGLEQNGGSFKSNHPTTILQTSQNKLSNSIKPFSQPSSQQRIGFLSQLTRRNSHKKSNGSTSLGTSLVQNSSSSGGSGGSRIGKISSPISITHTSTGSAMVGRTRMGFGGVGVGSVKGPRPLRKLSSVGSTVSDLGIRDDQKGEKNGMDRKSIEVGSLGEKSRRDGHEERDLVEMEIKLKRIMNVLPLACKDELREILGKENGDEIGTIGTYLKVEEERRGRGRGRVGGGGGRRRG
ncbi:uncharacterized protein MELLADRAFT_78810 [Melampsora larici-populina 98AG31]|uniref:Uncharacterized protein n=1 Tax=Melampsora larici-populina (strain 98AG31 / pathotype 3-4-7) TaxID=747676 RepID=F4RZ25_MELLP|nr:uncharacterized protein MELLADRAFT_78810 [Melampsora larici-populina 98AG31]EGG02343.1 hypothetical protein MELLADRAFT_78810 [Melampsora larici-populina 98AG31]